MFEELKLDKMIIENLAKRIDIVVEFPTEIWIVEVKDKLRPSGLGELYFYQYWYKKIYKPEKPVKLVYVAERDDVMVHEYCDRHNITVYLV